MYEHFSADYDDVFKAAEFKNLDDVESFGRRFRKVSLQLQDNECNKVVGRMTICASHAFAGDDLCFYDAIVKKVQHKEHSFESGEEECLCNFILNWQHGPNVGNLTSATVENICLIQHTTGIDPKVASFLKKSRDKIEMAYIITQLPKVGMEPKHKEYSHEMYSTSSINLFVAYVIVLPHLCL